MAVDLMTLLDANRLLLAEIDGRIADVEAREAKARAILDECAYEKDQIAQEKEAILMMDRLYRRRFLPEMQPDELDQISRRLNVPPDELRLDRRPKARVGAQRYRILMHLRSLNEPESPQEIAAATGLTIKRIKDQMRADVPERIVAEVNGKFYLQPLGRDLLERFENYKRSRGELLPSLDGPLNEDGPEDELPDVEERQQD